MHYLDYIAWGIFVDRRVTAELIFLMDVITQVLEIGMQHDRSAVAIYIYVQNKLDFCHFNFIWVCYRYWTCNTNSVAKYSDVKSKIWHINPETFPLDYERIFGMHIINTKLV